MIKINAKKRLYALVFIVGVIAIAGAITAVYEVQHQQHNSIKSANHQVTFYIDTNNNAKLKNKEQTSKVNINNQTGYFQEKFTISGTKVKSLADVMLPYTTAKNNENRQFFKEQSFPGLGSFLLNVYDVKNHDFYGFNSAKLYWEVFYNTTDSKDSNSAKVGISDIMLDSKIKNSFVFLKLTSD